MTTATMDRGAHAPQAHLSNGKFAMWIFLASEAMFFTGLLGSYVVLRMGHPRLFHADASHLNIPLAAINTVVLITSSLTMALAVQAVADRKLGAIRRNLLLTAGLGILFCVFKFIEYNAKFQAGITPGSSIFYSCYFGLTGVHLLHVIGGIIPFLGMAAVTGKGRFIQPGNITVELMGLYWHFVDVVWIFLFPLLYLIP